MVSGSVVVDTNVVFMRGSGSSIGNEPRALGQQH